MLYAAALWATAYSAGSHHGQKSLAYSAGSRHGHKSLMLQGNESSASPTNTSKPHILLMLVDDLGFGAVGYHRGITVGSLEVAANPEIITPNIDRLARSGIELDRFYTASMCSPSRCSLLSGRAPQHVNIENLNMMYADLSDEVNGYSGISRAMTTMPEKLKSVGYDTYVFGKWDIGMATKEHLPRGRGFDHGIIYFQHDNDYFTSVFKDQCPGESWEHLGEKLELPSLWAQMPDDSDELGSPALEYVSTCTSGNSSGLDASSGKGCTPGPKGDHDYGGYEDAMFQQQVTRTILQHDVEKPLFIFWSTHNIHAPEQVPPVFREMYSFIEEKDESDERRVTLHAQARFLDTALGNVVNVLHAKENMWDNTLLLFMSDNGGPVVNGHTNYPLKGGKFQVWEGGIRVPAWIAGGFVPEARRGTKYEGLVTIYDWVATLGGITGYDTSDPKAEKHDVPQMDSIDLSKAIFDGAHGHEFKRMEMPIPPGGAGGFQVDTHNLMTSAPLCSDLGISLTGGIRDTANAGDMWKSHNAEKDNPAAIAGDGKHREAAIVRMTEVHTSSVDDSCPYAQVAPPKNESEARCSSVHGMLFDDGGGKLWKMVYVVEDRYGTDAAVFPSFDFPMPKIYHKQVDATAAYNRWPDSCPPSKDCSAGCLFNLIEDPTEDKDIAHDNPDVVEKMLKMANKWAAKAWNPHKTQKRDIRACDQAKKQKAWGPFALDAPAV